MMTSGKLSLELSGATEEELTRGLAAAHGSFQAAGINPDEAGVRRFSRERLAHDGGAKVSKRDWVLASAWDDAETAALEATCEGWPEKPDWISLSLSNGWDGPDRLCRTAKEQALLDVLP